MVSLIKTIVELAKSSGNINLLTVLKYIRCLKRNNCNINIILIQVTVTLIVDFSSLNTIQIHAKKICVHQETILNSEGAVRHQRRTNITRIYGRGH